MDSRLAAAGVMLTLFLVGGVTGGVAVHLVEARAERAAWEARRERAREHDDRNRRPGDPRSFASSRVMDRLTERLALTPPQQDSVEAILDRQRSAANAVFREMGPRLKAMVDSTNARIRVLLDAEQQVRFDELLQEDRGVLGRPQSAQSDSTGRRR